MVQILSVCPSLMGRQILPLTILSLDPLHNGLEILSKYKCYCEDDEFTMLDSIDIM